MFNPQHHTNPTKTYSPKIQIHSPTLT